MSIRVKEAQEGTYPEAVDYTLYANSGAELTGASLTTVDNGAIVCAPGSRAYDLAGDMYILSDAGVWTKVV